jgi:hypothetical protein
MPRVLPVGAWYALAGGRARDFRAFRALLMRRERMPHARKGKLAMRYLERCVFGLLVDSAKADGFTLRRFACTPATGEQGDEITGEPVSLASAIAHANAWDSNSVAEFAHADGRDFWALLVWGNGEDVISDYADTRAARAIVERVSTILDSDV